MITLSKQTMLNMLETKKNIVSDKLFYDVRDFIIRELIFEYDGRNYWTSYRIGGKETPWMNTEKVVCFEKII